MMMKVVGAICILISSSALGVMKGLEVKRHLSSLLTLRQVMAMLKSEINYGRSELQEAFYNIGMKMKEPYKEWLLYLSRQLHRRAEGNIQTIWQDAVEQKLKGIGLSKEEKNELCEVGMRLGFMDKEFQEKAIEFYEVSLSHQIESARSEQDKRVKLCNCLGIMGGIFIIVILL